jgi:hypothetical protein
MQGHFIVLDGAAHVERRPPGPGELAHHLPSCPSVADREEAGAPARA